VSAICKILITTAVVGVLGSLAGLGVFGAFSATTQSSGDEVTAGTVSIGNNSAGQSMFSITGAHPGDSWTRCVRVTYTGSLPADVHLSLGGTPGPLVLYLNVKIEQGTASGSDTFPQCTTFNAISTLFDGSAASAGQSSGYAGGLVTDPAGVPGAWTTGSTTVFRMTGTLSPDAPNSDQAQSTGSLTLVWEAHNQ
jgi:hypothetical protein